MPPLDRGAQADRGMPWLDGAGADARAAGLAIELSLLLGLAPLLAAAAESG